VTGFVSKLLELTVVEGEGAVDASELSWSSLTIIRVERGTSGKRVDIAAS
jgi:hypothetical protein